MRQHVVVVERAIRENITFRLLQQTLQYLLNDSKHYLAKASICSLTPKQAPVAFHELHARCARRIICNTKLQ